MMSLLNSKSKKPIQGDYQFSEFIKTILPGDPSRYTITIFISTFLKAEGASRVAELQAKELSESGYPVVVYTFESDISPVGYKVKIIDSWIQTYAPCLRKLYRAFFPLNLWKSLTIGAALKKPNLIILHQETLVTAAYLAKIHYNTKVIFWHHHLKEPGLMTLDERLYNLTISPLNWKTIKKFDFVVSISEHSKTTLQKKKDVESIVIYDTIDSARFNRSKLRGTPIRTEYNIKLDDPVILFVGRIVPTKNVHSLIDAFKIVKKSLPNARLVVAGKSYDEQYSERLVRTSDQSVVFAGFVPDEKLPDYYAACDVYATCSLVEGFNMPLVEAQACGKPVVAFDIGPHKEVVEDGFLVPEGDIEKFGDTLIEILSHKD